MGRTRTYAGCTLNNPTSDEIKAIEALDPDLFRWGVWALKTGAEGTSHIQAAWSFKNGRTYSATKKLLHSDRWHFEEMKGTAFQAYSYCLKGEQNKEEWESEGINGENFGEGLHLLWTVGDAPEEEAKSRNQWDDIREMVEDGASDLEICAVYPQEGMRCRTAIRNYRLMWDRSRADWRSVEVVYLWGKTGTGKTRSVMQKYGYPNVYRITDYNTGSWDQYDGQDVVVFEEFRSSFKLEQMLNYLDGHPVELPCRYANQLAKFTKVFILTNIPLHEQYPSFHDEFASVGKGNSWDALKRRISGIIEVEEGQSIGVADLPILQGEE